MTIKLESQGHWIKNMNILAVKIGISEPIFKKPNHIWCECVVIGFGLNPVVSFVIKHYREGPSAAVLLDRPFDRRKQLNRD